MLPTILLIPFFWFYFPHFTFVSLVSSSLGPFLGLTLSFTTSALVKLLASYLMEIMHFGEEIVKGMLYLSWGTSEEVHRINTADVNFDHLVKVLSQPVSPLLCNYFSLCHL